MAVNSRQKSKSLKRVDKKLQTKIMKRKGIAPMSKNEQGYFQDGFSVLESSEMSNIQGGDRNNGTCSGNAICNGNGVCQGNGGRCVGNDNCNSANGCGTIIKQGTDLLNPCMNVCPPILQH